MQVKKRNINIGKAIYDGDIKTSAEGSIIVPDVKPDILKVLQVDAETFLCEKQIENGKITVKGKVNVTVLYVPESDDRCVSCLKGCFEFCETLKKQEFADDMDLIAVCDAQKVAYKLINSRKIGIEAQVLISIQVMANKECSFVCDVDSEKAEAKKGSIRLLGMNKYKEFSFSLEETLDFPKGKCAAEEILKSNVIILEKEYRALSGKLVIKGRVLASVLYLDENARCEHIEFEIPFTEVFDMEELCEDTECEVTYQICDTEFSLSAGVGGEEKCIIMTANVTVCVKCEAEEEVPVLCDCYFTDRECALECEEMESEEVADKLKFSAIIKELLQKGENTPDIEGVYTAVAKPYITSSQVQNGRIAVSGKTVVHILYTTDNPQIPVCSISEEIPFSYMIDSENASRDSEVLLSADCEHLSYTISSASSVEIRCGICINGKVVNKTSVNVIKDIEEREALTKESGMIIYFVKDGDDIWDISKRYHVKSESVLSCNGLDEYQQLTKGEKLIIPVTK